ncbi:hypothetical protein EJ08DRAFT_669487 [Tothia fuscella]|uniref:Uncharacterized protein n=1 Tax=Tothia fuscella TaxID=1048955 RepID=A0A9P4NWK4_9PEZI|nr:hypothetical protein EJ08DRAFT_669487 [Tothia fuscella]
MHYRLQWNNVGEGGWANLQLDIVGFLAILGEGSVMASSQVATLSKMIYLPRLLPAPQALLRPNRPDNLMPISGIATAVHSGNIRNYVNYIGHTLADAESLPEYSVKCVEIRRKQNVGEVKAKMFGPTHIVAILGCFLSCILFAMAIWQQDGMAMLADVCFSFLSTLIGVENKWKLNLPKRANKPNVWTPPGDVVIRYPKGSFLVVSCSEDIARELYFAPEGLKYWIATPWKYRMISLVGTILLMFGVIFLGNADTYLQIAFAGSYMVLNAAYWIVAALPQKSHWDMDCFEVKPQRFDPPPPPPPSAEDEKEVQEEKNGGFPEKQEKAKWTVAWPKWLPQKKQKPTRMDSLPKRRKQHVSYNKTFTLALWKVIVATRDIDWVLRSQAAPDTPAWKEWLHDALHEVNSIPKPPEPNEHEIFTYAIPDWDPQAALGAAMQNHKVDPEKAKLRATTDIPPRVQPPPPTDGA